MAFTDMCVVCWHSGLLYDGAISIVLILNVVVECTSVFMPARLMTPLTIVMW